MKEDPFDAAAEEPKLPSAFEIQKGRSQSLSTFSKDNAQGFRINQPEKEEVRIQKNCKRVFGDNFGIIFSSSS